MGVRIACGGLAAAEAGSVASAGFEVLRELLARGHLIDFYSKRSYVYPEALLAHPGFRYVDCSQPRIDHIASVPPNDCVRWLARLTANATTARRIIRRMREHHCVRPYDLELFLGQWAFGRVPGVPVISWVQGPPETDARSIVRHSQVIRHLCGAREYAQLRAYSMYRASLGRPPFRNTDTVICGSAWAREILCSRYGLSAAAVRPLPYPIDLEFFQPGPSVATKPMELVWLGRIVPRKRLDLFLDAGTELIADGRDVRLTVVGAFPFAKGFSQMLEDFPHPDRLAYLTHLPRRRVRRLLQSAAVLVQPSEEENFGSSVAEALACGTPVVVGPTNGTSDYIAGGGMRFVEYTSESVAKAVSETLDRLAGARAEVHVRAREAADMHFGVKHVVDRLEAIFSETVATYER